MLHQVSPFARLNPRVSLEIFGILTFPVNLHVLVPFSRGSNDSVCGAALSSLTVKVHESTDRLGVHH